MALHVVKALLEDGESFKVRISPSNMKYLKVQEGDFLLLKGTQSAVVPVGPSAPIIGSEAVIHLDPLTLSNAGTFLFSKIIVQKARALPAEEIVLIPRKIPIDQGGTEGDPQRTTSRDYRVGRQPYPGFPGRR